jgi:glycosyltransferase involved in cell wall biosynthesis
MPVEVRSLAEWEAAGVKGMLSLVIPAHNEEGHIAGTVKDLIGALSAAGVEYEILVVNDNSDDDTEYVLEELCREHPEVHYANNTPPGRYGFAVRRGLAQFRGDAVAIVMADGSDDPADLVRFYRTFQEGALLCFRIALHPRSVGLGLSGTQAGFEPSGQFVDSVPFPGSLQRHDQCLQAIQPRYDCRNPAVAVQPFQSYGRDAA